MFQLIIMVISWLWRTIVGQVCRRTDEDGKMCAVKGDFTSYCLQERGNRGAVSEPYWAERTFHGWF